MRSSTASHMACTRFSSTATRSRSAPGSSPGIISTTVTLRSERGVDGPELQSDVAAADHEQRCRDIGQIERAARIHHAGAVQPQAGDDARARSRREDGVLEARRAARRRRSARRTSWDPQSSRRPECSAPSGAARAARCRQSACRPPGSSTRAACRDRSGARRSGGPRPPRASLRSAASRRAGAPSTGCSRDTRTRRRVGLAVDQRDLHAEIGGEERRSIAPWACAEDGEFSRVRVIAELRGRSTVDRSPLSALQSPTVSVESPRQANGQPSTINGEREVSPLERHHEGLFERLERPSGGSGLRRHRR